MNTHMNLFEHNLWCDTNSLFGNTAYTICKWKLLQAEEFQHKLNPPHLSVMWCWFCTTVNIQHQRPCAFKSQRCCSLLKSFLEPGFTPCQKINTLALKNENQKGIKKPKEIMDGSLISSSGFGFYDVICFFIGLSNENAMQISHPR